jgi:hypothetical protein
MLYCEDRWGVKEGVWRGWLCVKGFRGVVDGSYVYCFVLFIYCFTTSFTFPASNAI